MKRRKIYSSWFDMRQRCSNQDDKNYGGRGIKVCDRWLEPYKQPRKGRGGSNPTQGFLNFLEDMGPTWFEGATIDRIDNDGDYTPENCQWLTKSDNSKKEADALIKKGSHILLGGKIQRQRTAAGLNPFSGGKLQRERVANGTHHFLGGKLQRERVANGTHSFLVNPPAKGTIWITNGVIDQRILRNQEIPNDFRRGRTK